MMPGEPAGPGAWAGVWLTCTVLAVSIGAFILAWDFVPATTRYFPLAVSAACILVASFDVARRSFVLGRTRGPLPDKENLSSGHSMFNEAADAPSSVVLRYAAWFFGYLAAIWLVTLIVASGVFVTAFLRYEARMSWRVSALSGVATVILVILIGRAFMVRWPSSLFDQLALLP